MRQLFAKILQNSKNFYDTSKNLYELNSVHLDHCLQNVQEIEQCDPIKDNTIMILKQMSLAYFIYSNAKECEDIHGSTEVPMDKIIECGLAFSAYSLTLDEITRGAAEIFENTRNILDFQFDNGAF